MELLKAYRLEVVSEGAESDTSDVISETVRMTGSDSVVFLASTVNAGDDTLFQVDGSDDGVSWVALPNAVAFGSRTVAIELIRPRAELLRLAIERPTATAIERCFALVSAPVQPAEQAADDFEAKVVYD